VVKVAIAATEPSPTIPGFKFAVDWAVVDSSSAREQSVTVARTVGPVWRENPYHRHPTTAMAIARAHTAQRRGRTGAPSPVSTRLVASASSLVISASVTNVI